MTLGEKSVKMMWDGGPQTLLVPDCPFFTPVPNLGSWRHLELLVCVLLQRPLRNSLWWVVVGLRAVDSGEGLGEEKGTKDVYVFYCQGNKLPQI